ncbi:tubulin-specific chaperone E [Clinocottus analis]|uniref:tubulin-specific chaperone E n=1 Tax=Clinocottus analis TaxID=304258 RepID=UPI0035C06911
MRENGASMGVDQPEVPEHSAGRRVSCDGERGTVRYVGLVPPTAGLWLGVEWDNPERGKHDGSHGGVRYFTCRHPEGGSFVRPAKVSSGVDYLTAVRQVYEFETETVLNEDISIASKKLKWIRLKGRGFENLQSALLGGCEVNGPGADGEIRETTPYVQWLDMSASLLSSWDDVSSITRQLDELETLQLGNNRLRLPCDVSAHCQAFCSLKVLVLNGCDLTWPQILQCAPMWPQLEDLSLEKNDITELQRPEAALQSLKSLNVSCNPLEQRSVLSLAALPRLEHLNLSETGLSDIRFGDAAPGSHTAMFPSLTKLNVKDNNITEWCVVDELGKLPSLTHFLCSGNQLVSSDGNPKTVNQLLVAKLEKLAFLNNCEVHHKERRGAELDYIKMFGEEWLKAGGGSQPSTQFIAQHPRYLRLIDKYGAPEEGELRKPEPFALKNQLLKITFVFPDDADRKPIEKKVLASMVVQKVKGLLYRLLKVPAADLKLSYTSPTKLGTEFEIDSDLKTLQFYSIQDGDQVLVRWS